MKSRNLARFLTILGLLGVMATLGVERKNKLSSVPPQSMADALRQVILADRAAYTLSVVEPLARDLKLPPASTIAGTGLPTPCELMRHGGERVQREGAEFHYALRSLTPLNPRNAPQTPAEHTGLEYVASQSTSNYYTEEVLGGRSYFTAVYPDVAVFPACVACHNARPESPRRDYQTNQVLGGLVVRVALEF